MTATENGTSWGQLDRLEFPVETKASKATSAFEHLGSLGLTSPRSGLRNAISVALVHRSYYHEHQDTLPGITQVSLEALNRLGDAFLQKTATAEIYRSAVDPTSGTMSSGVARVASTFSGWTTKQKWLCESAALATGLDREKLSPKITSSLFRQLIGVLCLEGEEEVAKQLLMEHITTQRQEFESGINDPKSFIYEALGYDSLTYEHEREGPDHALTFRSTVTEKHQRQRTGQGVGRSKKAADQEAALDFLQRHMPQAFTTQNRTGVRRRTSKEIPAPNSHVQAVRRLQNIFSLPEASRPLLSQALVHASWAYENRSLMSRCHQQDYQVLAYLGSQVLIYEHLLSAARHIVSDPPHKLIFITLPNDVYNIAFQRASLKDGLLLGSGQRSLGIPVEIGSNTFQAVIGAVSASRDFQGTLADRWPKEWAQVWQLVAPTMPRPVDPTTRLGRVASVMKLHITYEFRESGPDHARRSTAVAVLDSAALGIRFRVEGEPIVGRTPAKHSASLAVLDVLDRLADGSPAQSFDSADERDRSLARFLLAQQTLVLNNSPVPTERWIDARLFGLHLASDTSALLKWATDIDDFLGLGLPLQPGSHLRDTFQKTIERSVDPDHTLDTALTRVLDTLEQVETPEQLSQENIQRLVQQLCDVYRCLGADDSDVSLPNLIDDWRILYRNRIKMTTLLPSTQLSGRERAVVDAALSALMIGKREASVEFLDTRPLYFRIQSSQPPSQASIEEICALWSKVSRTTTAKATEHGIDVIITIPNSPTEPGPITEAVIAALHPSPEPYRAAVADLLHDLKNQLVAARLAEFQPAESRTARLQQQLNASRHLDQAHAIALRIRAATSILFPASSESIELGGFLRQYAGTVLARLPSNISLQIPEARSTVHVALDARSLSAVLDNLVGNAIEVLSDGGDITLAWTADEYEAVVEIADNGPGLPSDVAAALNAGKRVRSTKPQGNGLGLLGARSILAGVGGQISPASTTSGTAWLITLPLTPSTTLEPA
ncbi:ATP-binding protein [Streptomonospora nanhaiensis]|uniref:histidine kinase n=1 Tax=Streptomonospora nanhaiensis TaxID=1323731 RepID=A0ABY6YT81_9ACTN|nr:ATP-binding protein [Streptomonospora nanhaiensis]WAE75585.1 ATP-binding protein [Streptomonospora nanhaiensis]